MLELISKQGVKSQESEFRMWTDFAVLSVSARYFPTMWPTSFSFSLQMYSSSSPLSRRG
jgi:hypothetical protein